MDQLTSSKGKRERYISATSYLNVTYIKKSFGRSDRLSDFMQ